MKNLPLIPNRRARHIFLARHGLANAPNGSGRNDDLRALVHDLGFVQLDSINTVSRAHNMILHARRTAFRPSHLTRLHDHHRAVFEHWTHDASMISMAFFPYWRMKFRRYETKLAGHWQKIRRDDFVEKMDAVLKRITVHGPCCSAEVGEDEARSSGGWWDWHPSKTALEYLWRIGTISVTRREGFQKVYDLTENVIPDKYRDHDPGEAATIEWACSGALDRLGFATSGEIAAFWDIVSATEARAWCANALADGRIVEAAVEQADGSLRKSFLWPATLDEPATAPTTGLRVLSPFDPALRDRKRTERLFGFHYRIEIFVPEPKRKYGYYVFPLLEGDKLIGRVDMKAERDADRLVVKAMWPEAGIKFGTNRMKRLNTALTRTARLADVQELAFENGWLRQ